MCGSQASMRASHWAYLSRILNRQGVTVQATALEALPHDVELSEAVLARIDGHAPPPAPGDC